MGLRDWIKGQITTRVVDTQIDKVLHQVEVAYERSLRSWYISSLINLLIVVLMALAGWYGASRGQSAELASWAVSAMVWFLTIVFLVRRVQNVGQLWRAWPTIQRYGPLVWNSWWASPWGRKFRTASYAIYDDFYNAETSATTRRLIRWGERWKLVPGQDEAFDRFWTAFRQFFRTIIVSKLVQFALLAALVILLGWFVRVVVSAELADGSLGYWYSYPVIRAARALGWAGT